MAKQRPGHDTSTLGDPIERQSTGPVIRLFRPQNGRADVLHTLGVSTFGNSGHWGIGALGHSMDTNRVGLALQQRGVVNPCHRCGHLSFTVIDGFNKFIVQNDFRGGVAIDGASIPAINVACDNCGALTAHAVGALGLKLD